MGWKERGIFAPWDFFTFSLAVSDLDMFMPFGNQRFGVDVRTQIRRVAISEPVPTPSRFFFIPVEGAEVIGNLLRTISHSEEEPECSCS